MARKVADFLIKHHALILAMIIFTEGASPFGC